MKGSVNKNRKARLGEIARFVVGSDSQVDYVDIANTFKISPMQARNDLTYLLRENLVSTSSVLCDEGGINFKGDTIIKHKRKNPKKTGRKKYSGGY